MPRPEVFHPDRLTLRSRASDPPRAPAARTAVGTYFAEVAALEATMVFVLRRLRGELGRLGAPPSLLRDADQGARDCVAHARVMGRLAARYGAPAAPPPRIAPLPARDAFSLASDNASVGCIRVTYAALEAAYQSRRAADPVVRRVMDRIARDEARLAALAFAIDAWLVPQLTRQERVAVGHARDAAIGELRDELARPRDPSVAGVAGLPSAQRAVALVAALDRSLWRPAAA